LVKPDVAIVNILTVVTGVQQAPSGVQFIDGALHSRLEQVLVRRADGWWTASFHNVAVNPAYASGLHQNREKRYFCSVTDSDDSNRASIK
jgi:hypothetical protein